jgi:hypothetical protein
MSLLSFLFGRRPAEARSLAGDGLFRVEVVGESHYQAVLEEICGGHTEKGVRHDCVAMLVPEPENPHDRNAIRVDINGRTVGYLSRADAVGYRDGLNLAGAAIHPLRCRAVIRGGWKRPDGLGYFGVMLDLDWPPRLHRDRPRS